jgi:23S rRNA pseudouridine2605 synthase
VRLQKFIAHSGALSRRHAEAAIAQGRVRVNGATVTEMGVVIDPACDQVELDGKLLGQIETRETFAFHKPYQVMTTRSDPEGRKTVMDFFPGRADLYPVGRLDYETTGLLLLSNDGELANRLMHPRYEIEKTYEARVRGVPSPATLERLRRRVDLEDGPGAFLRVETLGTLADGSTRLEIIVGEGRNRFIRRMLECVAHPVLQLHRTRIGTLALEALKTGESRKLSNAELLALTEHKSPRQDPGP